MLDTRFPESFCAACTCASISEAVRFRENPLFPVAQKVQPILQPTWVEMQMETP